MSDNSNTGPKKSSRIALLILIVLIGAGGGYFIYEKGKQDEQRKVQIDQRISYLKEQLPHKQTELQMATDELNRINQFQFLRTPEEKEQQLTQQNRIINGIREDLGSLEQELATLQYSRVN